MNKVRAVIKREYFTRVRKKSFIITTILVPLGLLLLMGLPILMTQVKSGTTDIAIVSENPLFMDDNIKGNSNTNVLLVKGDFNYWKETYKEAGFDALLYIPNFDIQYPNGVELYSEKQIGLGQISMLEKQIESIVEAERFEKANISKELVNKLKVRLKIESKIISKDGVKTSSPLLSLIMGQGMGFFMYFMIFIYGSMIMKCVIDEKKNRTVEILVSSIKPFDMMLGKIVGIAAVALTQLLIWAILSVLIIAFFAVILIPYLAESSADITAMEEMATAAQSNLPNQIMEFISNPGAISLPAILLAFSFYFVFGYLFYSTLFASIGSVSDDETQSQQFTLPITIPVILSILIMTNVAEDPHSPIAFWGSIIPFSSPIVMLARIPHSVPTWQIITSAMTLILCFLGSTWAAGKIYRTGILLYGKKLNWKDLWRFIRS